MTSSAFPFLDGRASLNGPVLGAPRRPRRSNGEVLEGVRRRFRRTRPASGQRDHGA